MLKFRSQLAGLFLGMGFLLWISPVTQACRFNVREVGFVHFPEDAYYLYGLVRSDTPTAQVTAIEEKAQAIITESNIVFELIRIDQEKEHPALGHLPMKEIQSYPAFVLVSPSPENRMRILSIPQSNQPFSQRLQDLLENLILSPKRNEILKQIAEVYGFVLLFEGRDQEQNKVAAKVVDEVIQEVTEMLPNMPQPAYAPAPLEKGPVRINISPDEITNEEMLLWSFELTDRDPNLPHAVVVHGRGRIVGVPLAGAEIDAYTLGYFLSVIGADCECGLDRRWMQGRMIPLRWEDSTKARLAKSLGYDPENPMIMMEIARIVRRGYYPGGFTDFPKAADTQILGYQEIPIVVEDESNETQPVITESTTTETKDPPEQTTTTDGTPDKPKVKPAKLDIPMDPIPKQEPASKSPKRSDDDDTDPSFVSAYRIPLIMGAIMAASILIGGIVIGLRNRGRAA